MPSPESSISSIQSVKDKVVLVTGANRGIGEAFVRECLEQGAKKVYAAVRNVEQAQAIFAADKARVICFHVDLSKLETVEKVAALSKDVDIVINNAGVLSNTDPMSKDAIKRLQYEMEVNVYGLIGMAQAYIPILEARPEGGVFVQINSVASFRCAIPGVATYSASKAAAYSYTQALWQSLSDQQSPSKVRVISVHPGPIATDMIVKTSPELAKLSEDPRNVAKEVFSAMANPSIMHVFPDPKSKKLEATIKPLVAEVVESRRIYGAES